MIADIQANRDLILSVIIKRTAMVLDMMRQGGKQKRVMESTHPLVATTSGAAMSTQISEQILRGQLRGYPRGILYLTNNKLNRFAGGSQTCTSHKLKKIIAFTSVFGQRPGKERFEITVEVGPPYRCGEDPEGWAFPVAMRPLYKGLRDVHGSDSLQSLCLAICLAQDLLHDFREKGGSLRARVKISSHFRRPDLGQVCSI